MRIRRALILLPTFCCAALFRAPADSPRLAAETVATGVAQVVFVTAPPGDTQRLFIVQQSGVIRLKRLDQPGTSTTVFLPSIPGICAGGEAGLLGLAFHPDYAANGFFYIYYTGPQSRVYIKQYRRGNDFDTADPSSSLTILNFPHSCGIHNGGWMSFGPDGYLYVATGEDGQNAQRIVNDLNGKVLRLDVNGDDFPDDPDRNYAVPPDNPFVGLPGDDEIWVYGLRNPWRGSIDRATGDLWIGDVGQGAREEIDRIPFGVSGLNLGWRCMEGSRCNSTTPPCVCDSPPMTLPIYEYGRDVGSVVIGGYVYRGCSIPGYYGRYFFADYGRRWVMCARVVNGFLSEVSDVSAQLSPISLISSLGEDALGELYFCDISAGAVRKIVSAEGTRDCDADGVPDTCIATPPRGGDPNCDGALNAIDIDPFVIALSAGRAAWQAQFPCNYLCANDLDGDGLVTNFDVDVLVDCLAFGGCG